MRILPSEPTPAVVRARGYLAVCMSILAFFLAVCVGAFLDPAVGAQADPDWGFWAVALPMAALLVRGVFVGVSMTDDLVMKRGWFWTRSWPVTEIGYAGHSGYSGYLNRNSTSRRYHMVILVKPDDQHIEVPELSGRPGSVARFTQSLNRTLVTDQELSASITREEVSWLRSHSPGSRRPPARHRPPSATPPGPE